MEETQVLNTEQVPTDGNNPKVAAERVKQLHDALVADEVMKDYVPNDFRRFVEVYKDPKNMNSLYDALSADDVFKDYIPDSKERMYDLYVLGKQEIRTRQKNLHNLRCYNHHRMEALSSDLIRLLKQKNLSLVIYKKRKDSKTF